MANKNLVENSHGYIVPYEVQLFSVIMIKIS